MDIPAQSVTRATIIYTIDGIACQTGVHARNVSVLTPAQWRADVVLWAALFIARWKVIQATGVTYAGGTARVLGQPALPSFGFTGGGTGQIVSPALPALHYVQVDIKSRNTTPGGRRTRNAWRLSGIPFNIINDDSMQSNNVGTFLAGFAGLFPGVLLSNNSDWYWVTAHAVTQTTVTWHNVAGLSMRGGSRVLSSRVR